MKLAFKIILLASLLFSCSKDDTPLLNKKAEMLSFSIKEIEQDFSITENQIETMLVEERDLKNLTATFTTSPNAKVFIGNTIQASGFSKNDFTKPVTYTVQAEDGSKSSFVVKINNEAEIKTFKLSELGGVTFTIDGSNINATVPSGTKLKNLTAEFTVTNGTSLYIGDVLQVSNETKNDFDQPITYTAKSGKTSSRNYILTIIEAENNLPKANAGPDKIAVLQAGISTIGVNLNAGASSDAEAALVAFEWKQGGTVIGNSKKTQVNLPLGTHIIELTVTDTSGATATDSISIEVRAQGVYLPINSSATLETKRLFTNIANLATNNKFAFGQEFPLTFQLNSLSNSLNTSDCKDITGDHPAVFGIDPHYMIYRNATQRQLHIDEAKSAYNNGSIVTFDFHQRSRFSNKIYYNDLTEIRDRSLMYDVVNDLNGSRDWFFSKLDQVIAIINNDLGFPVVFRLFHEMDGDWFWWGTRATNHSPELYVDLYKLASDYIKQRSNLVLFGWTPNEKISVQYYPGDTSVDVVGIDVYDPIGATLKNNLIDLSNFALEHGKVAILSETGYRNYANKNPKFWTSNILKAIEDGGSDIRIAWALAWFNAPWHSTQDEIYIPNSNSAPAVKEDFVKFYESPSTLFQQEMSELNIYD